MNILNTLFGIKGKKATVELTPSVEVPVLGKTPTGAPHSRKVQRLIRVARALKNLESNPSPAAIAKREALLAEYNSTIKELENAKVAFEQITTATKVD